MSQSLLLTLSGFWESTQVVRLAQQVHHQMIQFIGSFIVFFLILSYAYWCVLPVFIAVDTCVHYQKRPEEGIGLPGIEVKDGCELPCGF
jgi:Na+/alanine symporter